MSFKGKNHVQLQNINDVSKQEVNALSNEALGFPVN
jgi:hypothetical protein